MIINLVKELMELNLSKKEVDQLISAVEILCSPNIKNSLSVFENVLKGLGFDGFLKLPENE